MARGLCHEFVYVCVGVWCGCVCGVCVVCVCVWCMCVCVCVCVVYVCACVCVVRVRVCVCGAFVCVCVCVDFIASSYCSAAKVHTSWHFVMLLHTSHWLCRHSIAESRFTVTNLISRPNSPYTQSYYTFFSSSLRSLSYDKFQASSNMSSPESAIYRYMFPVPVSSFFFKVIQ